MVEIENSGLGPSVDTQNFIRFVVGSPGMRAGDTLNRLKDDPKDTLALLAVKGSLDQLRNSLFTS